MENKITKINSEKKYEGKIVDLDVDTFKTSDGVEFTREIIRHKKVSCILAQLPNGKFIMERQYRYPYEKIIYELPGGPVKENEDHKVTAIRKLEEETGYFASTVSYLGKIYPSVGYTDEVIYLYYATDLTKTKASINDEEDIELFEVSMEDIIRMIKDGTIVDAKTICAICDYKLNIL